MKDWFTTEYIFNLIKDRYEYRNFYKWTPADNRYELKVVRMNTGDVYVWACENYIKPHSKCFARYDSLTKKWTKRGNRFVKIID